MSSLFDISLLCAEPLEVEEASLLRCRVSVILRKLHRKDSKVIKLRFGYDDGQAHSSEEVAHTLRMTQEHVCNIENLFGRSLRARLLNDFIGSVIKRKNGADWNSCSISVLDLSTRSRVCMRRLGISTIGELVRKTAEDLLDMDGLGQITLSEIRDKLGEKDLILKGD